MRLSNTDSLFFDQLGPGESFLQEFNSPFYKISLDKRNQKAEIEVLTKTLHMKKIIGFILIFFVLACDDTLPDIEFAEIDPFIQETYFDDAVELYIREIVANPKHFNYNNPELDEMELNKILSVFQTVHNLQIPETDTVFNFYHIHALKCNSSKSIVMHVNTEAPEIIKLANGEIPTGNKQLDYLLKTYEFDSVRTSFSYPQFAWISVNTENTYNLLPIIKAFEKIPSIALAENNGGCFDGNNIKLERGVDKTTIDFSIGRGDCPAGCIYRKHWVFEVENGVARLVKVYER
jgi:hypothetical protein